jgi:prepilin-type N-terminal cleavage/methylation domain-containing protein
MDAPRHHAHRNWTSAGRAIGSTRGGFTLTELMVVIGIAVLLVGLLVPIGRSLQTGNRALTCKAQLQQIGTAMKAYYIDEGGVPPFYIDQDDDPTDPTANPPTGPGLMALYETGYLPRREALHCPSDIDSKIDQELYFKSYQRLDEDAGVQVALNAHS